MNGMGDGMGPGVFRGEKVDPTNQALDGFGHIAQHGPWKLEFNVPTQVGAQVIMGFHQIGITCSLKLRVRPWK